RPRLVVRWDEIDKSVSSAASGTIADNTGVRQDMLKGLLTSMQDNNWLGTILVGAPGTGKTLSSVCTGNTFQVRTLVGDLGAARLLGRRVRTPHPGHDGHHLGRWWSGCLVSGHRQPSGHITSRAPASLQPGHLVFRRAQ